MRFLAISLCILFSCTSCSLKTTEGLRTVPTTVSEVKNQYFSNPAEDYVYKASIDIYNKNFGGILIIKKTGNKEHRVVFTTEFGNKLFDFQYQDNTFTKKFILNKLDKKLIVNTLKSDFKLLINDNVLVDETYATNEEIIYKSEDGKRFNYYFLKDDQLEKIVRTSKTKEKVTITFKNLYEEKEFAEQIFIQHSNFKLRIELEKFKNN